MYFLPMAQSALREQGVPLPQAIVTEVFYSTEPMYNLLAPHRAQQLRSMVLLVLETAITQGSPLIQIPLLPSL